MDHIRDTAGLIAFVREAFGAEEIARVHNEDGTIGHAEFRIGDSVVMGFDAKEEWPGAPAFLRLYVEDADEVHRRALEAGAASVTEVTHLFWGDRVGRVRDPFGNLWWIQTRVEEVDPVGDGAACGGEGVDRADGVRSGLTRPGAWEPDVMGRITFSPE